MTQRISDYVRHGVARITRYTMGNGESEVLIELIDAVVPWWRITPKRNDGLKYEAKVLVTQDEGKAAMKAAQDLVDILERLVAARRLVDAHKGALQMHLSEMEAAWHKQCDALIELNPKNSSRVVTHEAASSGD